MRSFTNIRQPFIVGIDSKKTLFLRGSTILEELNLTRTT